MALSQHVWDNAESAAWIDAATEGTDDLRAKRFVYLVALHDAQVPNLSSNIAARTAGLPVLEGSVTEPWGLGTVSSPYTGSAFVAYDMGDPEPPPGNVAPAEDAGGHGSVGFTPAAQEMINHFFATGEVIDACDGPCEF